mgnify:CR=1 FL=1
MDGGAISCAGIPESRYNLEISLKLNDLMHLLGYETVMIRREDISVYTEGETIAGKKASDLKQRVKMVEAENDAVLLSIHQNYFPQAQYSGAQTFYAGTSGSQSLAKAMQAAFTRYLDPVRPRQEKMSSGVYLMEHVSCPAVLIECGFLSNTEECRLLCTDLYQNELTKIISEEIKKYVEKISKLY